ncbi:basic amino acid ABC transporter substrate-binding protein [Halobacteriales archaeon QS_8_69_26]|nr:MAG: basic amino acid ABC transporter substrate-binding protein [Halobacteriales archaeon QS_8_69_26]
MARKFETDWTADRRTYLRAVGAIGAAGASTAIAGCLGDQEEIVPGTASGFAPFEYINDDGDLVGFDVELAEEAIDRAGYGVGDWVDQEFDTLLASLQNEDFDLAAAALSITPERQQNVDFTDPYYEVNQAVVVREGGDFSPSGTDDLSGRVIGAQGGTTGEGEVDKLIDDGVVDEDDKRTYDNYVLAIEDLENGNIDAVVVDVPVARNFADSRSVEVAFTIETGEQYAFAMRNGDERIPEINDALTEIQDDGTYDDLVQKYFQ